MDIDHDSMLLESNLIQAAPMVLAPQPGQFVIVQPPGHVGEPASDDWWMGQVLWSGNKVSGKETNPLCQIADVENGMVRWVDTQFVTHIVHSLDGLTMSEFTEQWVYP